MTMKLNRTSFVEVRDGFYSHSDEILIRSENENS
jgi:hypothetical protein